MTDDLSPTRDHANDHRQQDDDDDDKARVWRPGFRLQQARTPKHVHPRTDGAHAQA